MRTLLDTTFIHRISVATAARDSLSLHDCCGVLALAEQIMFCDGIEITGFETDSVRDRSHETVTTLQREGVGSSQCPIISLYPFSRAEYAHACIKSTLDIRAIIENTSREQALSIGRQVDSATRPLGVKEQPLFEWLGPKERGKQELADIRAHALEEKAIGGYDYIAASDVNIRRRLKEIGRCREDDRRTIANGLSLIFRSTINQHLAENRGGFYAPAPKRAEIVSNASQLARTQLATRIVRLVDAKRGTRGARSLSHVVGTDIRIPLPIFAIHFLRAKKARGVFDILSKAAELRHEKEVIALREFFGRFETAAIEADPLLRLKMEARISQCIRDIESDIDSVNSPGFTLLLVALDPLLKRINADFDLKLNELPRDFETGLELVTAWRRRLLLGRMTAGLMQKQGLYAELSRLFGDIRIVREH